MTLSNYLCTVNSITRHIEYLILRYDCVIVPNLGAFIAQYLPARIDEEAGVIIPPSRELSFNSQVAHNDGLLAASIARATGNTFDIALSAIESQVAALKSQTENGGEFAIGRLGILKQNQEGNLEFEPFKSTAISPRLTGLPSFSLSPYEVSANTESKIIPAHSRFRRICNTTFRAAASVALLIGLGVMLSTPVLEHNSEMAGLGKSITFRQSEPEEIIIPNPNQVLSFSNVNPDDATAVIKTEETATDILTAALQEKPVPAMPNEAAYYLIVASLPTKEKAEEYIASHPDSSLNILASENRYRVYSASGATYNEMQSTLSSDDTSAKYPDAWIYRR